MQKTSLSKTILVSAFSAASLIGLTQANEEIKKSSERGKAIYTQSCAMCHQATGKGIPGAFPPLFQSDWVKKSDKKLALIVLNGLSGPITVNGKSYTSMMPAQGAALDDQKIADVLTYVRAHFGNSSAAVKKETVTALRAKYAKHEPWTAETLKKEIKEEPKKEAEKKGEAKKK